MLIKNIKIGEFYRYKREKFCYAKALKILKPREQENNTPFIIVKCEWLVDKNSNFGIIRYFRPKDLTLAI